MIFTYLENLESIFWYNLWKIVLGKRFFFQICKSNKISVEWLQFFFSEKLIQYVVIVMFFFACDGAKVMKLWIDYLKHVLSFYYRHIHFWLQSLGSAEKLHVFLSIFYYYIILSICRLPFTYKLHAHFTMNDLVIFENSHKTFHSKLKIFSGYLLHRISHYTTIMTSRFSTDMPLQSRNFINKPTYDAKDTLIRIV